MNRILRLDWLGAAFGVALVFVLLSVLSPYFLTSDNILTILVQTAVVAILAGGQTFVILTAQIDLATAAAAALAGAVVGMLMVHAGLNPCRNGSLRHLGRKMSSGRDKVNKNLIM